MALPDPENLAYRGINTGDAGCIAYRGFICSVKEIWNKAIRVTLTIVRSIRA